MTATTIRNRVNSSRQDIAAVNRNSNITRYFARQPLAPASPVLKQSILDETITTSVVSRIAEEPLYRGGVSVAAGEHYYLVESPKFAHRFYITKWNGTSYECSSEDPNTKAYCAEQVKTYLQALVAVAC